MPELLTRQHFEPLVHQRWVVHVDENNCFEVELIQLDVLPSHSLRGGAKPLREPFSLIFRGPREKLVPQRLYALQHETLGTNDIFLVPIGPDEFGQRYQAIFN